MKAPLVRVVSVRFQQSSYAKWGHGRNWLLLACGHDTAIKGSKPIPKRARCRQCPQVEEKGR